MWSGSRRMRSSATVTGIAVRSVSSGPIIDGWAGERCCTTQYAAPVSAGTLRNIRSSASNPPADAPTPTTYSVESAVAGSPPAITAPGAVPSPAVASSLIPTPCLRASVRPAIERRAGRVSYQGVPQYHRGSREKRTGGGSHEDRREVRGG